MPVEVNLDRATQLTIYRVCGELDLTQLHQLLHAQYKNGPTLHTLWDLREGRLSGVTPADLRELAIELKELSNARTGGKTAFVAVNDLEYGLSRVAMSIGENSQFPIAVRSFRDFEQALAWIRQDN